jgi:hypothetical protein
MGIQLTVMIPIRARGTVQGISSFHFYVFSRCGGAAGSSHLDHADIKPYFSNSVFFPLF